MNESTINVIGYIASFFISLNLFPQILTIIKKKSGKNISYFSIVMNIIATVLMFVYSINKKLYPVIISNVVIFISSFIILILKKYYKSIELNYYNLSNNNNNDNNNNNNNDNNNNQVINKIQLDEIIEIEFENSNNCI